MIFFSSLARLLAGGEITGCFHSKLSKGHGPPAPPARAAQHSCCSCCCSVSQSCPTLCSPMTAARQACLSITNSQSLLKLTSIESVMPSNQLVLHHPLLLPPSIFASFRVFSNESALHQVAKVLELQLQHQSFQRIFRVDFL